MLLDGSMQLDSRRYLYTLLFSTRFTHFIDSEKTGPVPSVHVISLHWSSPQGPPPPRPVRRYLLDKPCRCGAITSVGFSNYLRIFASNVNARDLTPRIPQVLLYLIRKSTRAIYPLERFHLASCCWPNSINFKSGHVTHIN